jgi:hypothetical protein
LTEELADSHLKEAQRYNGCQARVCLKPFTDNNVAIDTGKLRMEVVLPVQAAIMSKNNAL